MKIINIGIKPTILMIFSFIVAITLLVTLGLQYYFSQTSTLKSIKQNMEKTASIASMEINNIDNSVTNIITVTQLLNETKQKPKELLNHSLTNKLALPFYICNLFRV